MTLSGTGLDCTKKPPVPERRRGGDGWTDSRMMTAWICGMTINNQEVMMRNVADCGDTTTHGTMLHAAVLMDSSVNAVSGFTGNCFT